MYYYNGIKLEYKNVKRNNYMSLTDLVQDLNTDNLIKILPTIKELNNQMVIMKEIEKRNELDENYLCELLESCNGI